MFLLRLALKAGKELAGGVRPRIVGLGCGVPLEEVGDAGVHLAASDDHDSVCAVPAVVNVQSVALNTFPGMNRCSLAVQIHEPRLHAGSRYLFVHLLMSDI